jgi:hypothetical protein
MWYVLYYIMLFFIRVLFYSSMFLFIFRNKMKRMMLKTFHFQKVWWRATRLSFELVVGGTWQKARDL